MFYRLAYLLSFYYEKHNKLVEAVNLLKILLNSSAFPLAISNSFRKLALELAKKGKIIA